MWPHNDKIPVNSLLAVFSANGTKVYKDCYCIAIPVACDQKNKNLQDNAINNFAISFFTSPIFALEAKILSFVGMRGPSNREIEGQPEPSSKLKPAFVIEAKNESEVIFKSAEHIRTWLQISEQRGIIYFRLGSAIDFSKANLTTGWLTWALQPFHQIYSRVLLYSAVRHYQRDKKK